MPEMKVVNPDPPPEPLTGAAMAEIAALAQRQRQANGVLMKAINFMGSQVDDVLRMLPAGARGQIEDAAKSALEHSYEVAARSRTAPAGQMIRGDRAHRILTTISGALGGIGGLPTALAELPVATTMIFRAVQDVAETHGEDPSAPETRLNCLAVFGAGGPLADDDSLDTAFFGARFALTGGAVHGLLAKVAPRFATVLTQKLASQAVPLLGAAAGAGTNYAFSGYYVEMAHVHFGLRRLSRDHGDDAVLEAFHAHLAQRPITRA